jgi:hypothetical protein
VERAIALRAWAIYAAPTPFLARPAGPTWIPHHLKFRYRGQDTQPAPTKPRKIKKQILLLQ